MAFTFQLVLLLIGLIACYFAYWNKAEIQDSEVFVISLIGPVGLALYGSINWLKKGHWETITAAETIIEHGKSGIKVDFFFTPVSWLEYKNGAKSI